MCISNAKTSFVCLRIEQISKCVMDNESQVSPIRELHIWKIEGRIE